MKNIFYSLLIIMVAWTGSSCSDTSFLDETVTTDLDYEKVFADSTLTEGFLNEIYRQIGFDTRANRFSKDGENLGGLQTACDEAEYKMTSKVTADVQFATGTVNPVVITDDAWKIPYENIRRVNQFFKGIEKTRMQPELKIRLKAEARFLRAWYYSILLRHYGGVPLIGDTIYSENDAIKGTRDTYDACIQYIVNESLTAAESLDIKASGKLYGRASVGACYALIARLKLYAASPLFNGNSDIVSGTAFPAELIGYPEYKAERWKEAMDAAHKVIDLGRMGYYKLFVLHKDPLNNNASDPGHGFYAQFIAADSRYTSSNPLVEAILEDRSQSNRARESWFQPPSRGGSGGGYIYQELVDAFPMKNGLPINNLESGYDDKNPYKDRDPRLRNTVVYDGVPLQSNSGSRTPIIIALNSDGSSSGQDAVHQGTPTGYYINKMVNRDLAANTVHGGPQQTPLIRYAEILMMYAEAKNEFAMATQGENGIVPVDEETYEYLKQIRKRAGIDSISIPGYMFGLKVNMTRLEMRKAIQNEKRIEFAIEGHRFWDVRRWLIAAETENRQMHGMEPRMKTDGNKEYNGFSVRKRVFRKAMYFWPIPYKETIKSPGLIQNPNYNL